MGQLLPGGLGLYDGWLVAVAFNTPVVQDLPNRLGKVAVRDRTLVTTEDAERRVVTPAGLQQGINAIVAEYSGGRSFVRPSGTEDCVRVYSEAETREAADTINTRVSQLVVQMIG